MKYVSIVYILSDSIPGQSDDHTYLSDEHTEHTVRVWVRSTQTHGAIMLSLFYFILFYFILFYLYVLQGVKYLVSLCRPDRIVEHPHKPKYTYVARPKKAKNACMRAMPLRPYQPPPRPHRPRPRTVHSSVAISSLRFSVRKPNPTLSRPRRSMKNDHTNRCTSGGTSEPLRKEWVMGDRVWRWTR
jgi:hypothetical protein